MLPGEVDQGYQKKVVQSYDKKPMCCYNDYLNIYDEKYSTKDFFGYAVDWPTY